MIPVEKIHLDPAQPREIYRGLEPLAESIFQSGFQSDQAISVWHHPDLPDGEYMVINGHRRTQAAKMAQLQEIPCFIYDGLSAREVWEKQLIDNTNRDDLSIMNKVRSYQRSIEEHGMDIQQVAKIHGVTVKTIQEDLVLTKLHPDLHKFVDNGNITKEVAKKLATTFPDPGQQMFEFNNSIKGKNTKNALATIEERKNQIDQTDMWAEARKNAEDTGLMPARKATDRLLNAVSGFEKFIGDKNVLNAKKKPADLRKLEATVKLMEKAARALRDDIAAFRARNELNSPKKAVNE